MMSPSPTPCESPKQQWPLLDFQPRQCAPDEIRDRRAHKPLGSSRFHHQPYSASPARQQGNLCLSAWNHVLLSRPVASFKQWNREFPLSWKCSACHPHYPYQQTTMQPGEAPVCPGPVGYHCKMFSSLFPLPWIQSMTSTSGIQSGQLPDSPAGK